jgi:hypothetical protein
MTGSHESPAWFPADHGPGLTRPEQMVLFDIEPVMALSARRSESGLSPLSGTLKRQVRGETVNSMEPSGSLLRIRK